MNREQTLKELHKLGRRIAQASGDASHDYDEAERSFAKAFQVLDGLIAAYGDDPDGAACMFNDSEVNEIHYRIALQTVEGALTAAQIVIANALDTYNMRDKREMIEESLEPHD